VNDEFCPDCGDELDGFSPCSCGLLAIKSKPVAPPTAKAASARLYGNSMRALATRRWARVRSERSGTA
jgi:hypothetical protein